MPYIDPDPIFEVIESLLGPGGCPWDKEQTPKSLCEYLLEETYELVDAIRTDSGDSINDELGDVFFLLCFLSTLLKRQGVIVIQEVFEKSASKMIRRHPHVFQDMQFNNREELHKKWEEIKSQEKLNQSQDQAGFDPLDSIPVSLPPLMKAYRIHSKAAKAGFTWESESEQAKSLAHEWQEWLKAKEGKDQGQMEDEFGDVLFSLVEHGRWHKVKADSALQKACQKFLTRWKSMQNQVRAKGLDWHDLTLEEKNRLWEEVKTQGMRIEKKNMDQGV